MNNLNKYFISLLLLGAAGSLQVQAAPPTEKDVPIKVSTPELPDIDPEDIRRCPSRLFHITISLENGIIVPEELQEEILTFEAYDEAGNCMAVFADEASFIEFFFSTEEIAMVRFTTASYVYTGWL